MVIWRTVPITYKLEMRTVCMVREYMFCSRQCVIEEVYHSKRDMGVAQVRTKETFF